MLGVVKAPDGEQDPGLGNSLTAFFSPVVAPTMLGGKCLFIFLFLDLSAF